MSPQSSPISLLRALARPMIVLMALLMLSGSAHATNYVVNSLTDTIATDGVITLREAISAADSNFARGDAPAGGASDTITFGVTGTIRLTSALPSISSAVAINGPTSLGVTISGDANGSGTPNAGDVAVFLIEGGGNVTISNLTVSGGFDAGIGTALTNFGTLLLDNVTFSGNRSDGGGILNSAGTLTVNNSTFSGNIGGAILNGGPLIINNSRFIGNTNPSNGGAINSEVPSQSISPFTLIIRDSVFSGNTSGGDGGALDSNGPLQIARCTFAGNSATGASSFGGAINITYTNSTQSGAITLSDSTLSGNSSKGGGGGLSVDTDDGGNGSAVPVVMTNCTVSGNTALAGGGGIVNFTGTLRLQNVTVTANNATGADNIGDGVASLNDVGVRTEVSNSIISGNLGNDVSSDFVQDGTASTLFSLGYNLIGGGTNAGFNQTGDQRNVANPNLGALANNGGPTQTHLPQSGSPAIDKGDTTLTTDQRGPAFTRPVGTADDIGAVEVGAGPRVLNFGVSIAPKSPVTNDTLTATPVVGADGTGATFTYVWSVNGVVRPSETTNKLDLSKAGNGDKGDKVSVVVTASNNGATGSATNFVNIVNSAPIAQNATASGDAGALISVPVAGSDADGDPITFKSVGGPTNGTGSFTTSGGVTSFNYTSRAFFNGTETIRFVALDNIGKPSAVATISIAVTGQPRVIGFGVSLLPFGPTSNTILTAQPLIGDGAGVTYAYAWSVNGAVRPGETGQTIDLGKAGNGNRGDTISVVVTATRGIDSGTASNSALIVSAAPVANDATASGAAGAQIVIPISGSDADGDAFSFKSVGGPRNGVGEFVTDSAGKTTFVYRSRARFNGTETIRFVAIQADGRSSAPATITINVTSSVPDIGFGVALTPSGPTTNQTLTAVPVITNASGVSFTYAWSVNGVAVPGETSNTLDLSKPSHGDRGDVVTAIVTARRGDSNSVSRNSATVFNSAPSTQNASGSGISGSEIMIPIVAADADRDALTFKSVGGPRNGSGSFVTDANGNTTFIYRSQAGFVGSEEIRFVAVDPVNRTATPATIAINVTPSSGAARSSASALQAATNSGGSS